MGKLNKLAFMFALVLIALLNVSAQELTFDDEALIALKKISAQEMKDRNLRIITTEEWLKDENKNPVRFEKSISENVPPDRNRFVSEKRTATGIERTEYINIGAKRFIKYNDNEWKELKGIEGGSGYGEGNGSGSNIQPKIESTVSKIMKKGEIVNNQMVDLYKTVITKKYIYPTITYTNISTEAFWFDGSSKLVKTLSEFQEGEAKSVSRKTQEYEYDPKLKIEPPIIEGKRKVAGKN